MSILKNEQIEQYKKQGFLLIENFFSEDEIHKVSNIIHKALESGNNNDIAEFEPNDKSIIRRIWSPTEKFDILRKMAFSEKLLDCVEQLIGNNIISQYNKLNMKGPKVGSLVDWHQDFAYYPHTNTDLLSVMIHLDDSNENNGCLEVISQEEYDGKLLEHTINNSFKGKIPSDKLSGKKIKLPAKKGSVIFLHCLTAHYSAINTSNDYRKVFIPAYRAADAFPIYYGPHASHNEPKAHIVRGKSSHTARLTSNEFYLPLADKEFGSIYEIQEGVHLSKNNPIEGKRGYYSN